jgi:hypothetical protein
MKIVFTTRKAGAQGGGRDRVRVTFEKVAFSHLKALDTSVEVREAVERRFGGPGLEELDKLLNAPPSPRPPVYQPSPTPVSGFPDALSLVSEGSTPTKWYLGGVVVYEEVLEADPARPPKVEAEVSLKERVRRCLPSSKYRTYRLDEAVFEGVIED